MKRINICCIGICWLLLAGSAGCKKSLDEKPNSLANVPETITDCQQLLENTSVMTFTPVLGDVSSDNFILSFTTWQGLNSRERNTYVWAADIFQGQGGVDDWNISYQQVYYANVVLECLQKITITPLNEQAWRNVRGAALFIRSYAFYNLMQLFAPVYDSTKAATALGIPLRLQSDVSLLSVRSTVKANYEQIIQDLLEARQLLPATVPNTNPNRPSQPAALGMLSKIYLSMGAYDQAGAYADSVLQVHGALLDYNTLNKTTLFPFSNINNPEIIYQSYVVTYTRCLAAAAYPGTVISPSLYSQYSSNDLRKSLFFRMNSQGQPNMKGSYANVVFPFTGLATDEFVLIRAECKARAHQTAAAMDDLNRLLEARTVTGAFIPLTAASWQAALEIILTERRKEMPFRGTRWTDLRRLNKEGRNIILTRQLNGQTYELLPNSNLYTLPIPPDVIDKNPGMQQTTRS